ncbi:family 1 glycosylhydrolase [Dactylosporangium sp. CA-052675]|uniref:family 1 glycosylhydrolase n=1 Tax=Dactylosporangium sp. CA-052675 TaxID=3239927 RepID=UPI003D91A1BD
MPDARQFPDGFLWGAATSAHQVEGGNTNNDWWDFEQAPGTAARCSSADGIDHLHRYADDFALLAALGHNAHRLSLEWSRIEPAPGAFSAAALGHYRRVLTALRDTGMTPFVTLHHFTLPRWLAAAGGWLAADAVTRFERYCSHVTTELGDLMPYVCTICAIVPATRIAAAGGYGVTTTSAHRHPIRPGRRRALAVPHQPSPATGERRTANGYHTGLLVSAPMHLPGGAGSPANALALL